MGIYSRHTRILAVVGVLALGAASTVRAQDTASASRKDTSAAARSDTSGYQSYQNQATDTLRLQPDSMRKDSSGFKYNGPPTDTTLKAKPGAQTGRNAGDSTSAAEQAGNAGAADTVVCKDGNKMVGASACDIGHGGIDAAATRAAKKARGQTVIPDTRDTSSSSQQQ
jgi:hypothetical protein